MLSSDKMTYDQRVNMSSMSDPLTPALAPSPLKRGCVCLSRNFCSGNSQRNHGSGMAELRGARTKEKPRKSVAKCLLLHERV